MFAKFKTEKTTKYTFIVFLVIIFLFFCYLSIPSLFKFDKFKSNLEKKIYKFKMTNYISKCKPSRKGYVCHLAAKNSVFTHS